MRARGVHTQPPPSTGGGVEILDRHFDCSSGKSSTVPELLPKKYVALRLLRSFTLKSNFATTLSTPTWLGKPLTILIDGLVFVGKPVPSQDTTPPEIAHPATFRLAGLIVTPCACKSATAFGILPAQSPVVERQFPASGIATIDGLGTPPKAFPTS